MALNEMFDTEEFNMIRMAIVDDFIETAETLSMLYRLRNDVEIVGIVHNGEQLWQVLRKEEVNLVSLDIQLGHENGFELCQVLHEKYPDLFIVMCSVEATIENKRLATEAGAAHFLAKPVTMNNVSETLQLYLNYKKGTNEALSPLTGEKLDELFDAFK